MFKIIKIDGDTVFVGKGDGQFTQINRSAFGFEPKIGDQVEFYESNGVYIVSKVDSLAGFTQTNATAQGQIKGQSSKSRTTAGILAIFDALGLYHFYIGKTGIGILRLVLSLIPFTWVIIWPINLVAAIVLPILVFTSKPGSSWHQDAQGLELQD